MSRSKKNSPPPAPGALSSTVFQDFLKTISNTKQRVADAQTDHSREFKKCESLGIHSDATKLLQRLDKMSDEKRADFLHFFDMVRPWMGWDEQLDMLEHADQQQGIAAASEDDDLVEDDDFGETGYSDEHEQQESAPAELTFASAEREEVDPMLEETARAWEGTDETPVDEESLDQGGYTFAEGKAAGREGKSAEDNQHPAGTPSHNLWESGRTAGHREREAAGEADAENLDVPDFLRRQPVDGNGGYEAIEGDTQFAEDDTNIVNLFGESDEDEVDTTVIAVAAESDVSTLAAQ